MAIENGCAAHGFGVHSIVPRANAVIVELLIGESKVRPVFTDQCAPSVGACSHGCIALQTLSNERRLARQFEPPADGIETTEPSGLFATARGRIAAIVVMQGAEHMLRGFEFRADVVTHAPID